MAGFEGEDSRRAEEAIRKYCARFGGWPLFLMMGASDEEIVERVEEALETGREIEAEPGLLY